MNDVQLGDLVVRMLVSLVIVLALILVAYAIVKRRRNGPPMRSANKPSLRGLLGNVSKRSAGSSAMSTSMSTVSTRRSPRQGSSKRGLQSVGRVGLSRSSSVVAVQFAERVYLLGTSETTAPNVIADVSLEEWERSLEVPVEMVTSSMSGAAAGPVGAGGKPVVGIPVEAERRTKLLDALREATTRRG